MFFFKKLLISIVVSLQKLLGDFLLTETMAEHARIKHNSLFNEENEDINCIHSFKKMLISKR